MRQLLRNLFLSVARWLGSDIHDAATGKKLGRALLLPWRGRVIVIGLDAVVAVHFLPQTRLTYWNQQIGFQAATPPDFPHEPRA